MPAAETTSIDTNSKDALLHRVQELQARVQQLEAQLESQTEQISQLILNEEKYKILLDGSSDPIFSFSRDGEYQYVNYAFAEGVQKPVEDIIHHRI